MQTMTLKEALTRRQVYREKFGILLSNKPMIGAITIGQNPPEGYSSTDQFKNLQQSEWDKRISLRKNIINLTTAIQKANSEHEVNINGIGTISIAGALELHELFYPFDRKNKNRKKFIDDFQTLIAIECASIIKTRDKKIERIEQNATQSAETLVKDISDPNLKKSKFKEIKEAYIADNKVEIHQWKGLTKHLEWYEKITDVDLSKLIEVAVQNASANITISVDLTGDDSSETSLDIL